MNTKFPQYRRVRRVGGGAFGDVYDGHLLDQPNTRVAIKVLKESCPVAVDEEEEVRSEVKREVNALRLCGTHPNIVEFLGIGQRAEDPHELGMVFEFCEYGHLREHLATYWLGGQLSEAEVFALMKKICAGLKQIHAAGIMHCDLKPDNILVASGGELKIADFGLTQIIKVITNCESTTRTLDGLGGTPGFADPAVWKQYLVTGKSRGSRKWDIWSVGAILYELLVGRPFCPTVAEWKTFVRSANAQRLVDDKIATNIPTGISDDLRSFLVGCLKTETDQRLSVADFYAHPYWKGELN